MASRALARSAAQSLQHELAQKLARRGTVRRVEGRKLRFAEGQFEVAALGDFPRARQPIGMLLAGVGHFRRRTKVQPSVRSLLRMFLPQQGQRADALHDVVFLAVARQRIMNCRTGHGRKAIRTRRSSPSGRNCPKQLRQLVRPGLTAINPSVKPANSSNPVRPPLLVGARKPSSHFQFSLRHAGTAAGTGWHSHALIRRRGASGWSPTDNSTPTIGLMPACCAA